MAYSYSSISKYNTCPRSYYHTYIAKDSVYTDSEAAKYGSEMHDFIDQAYKGLKDFSPRYEFLKPIVVALQSAQGEVKTEYELSFKEDKTSTDWKDKTAFIKGKSDVTIFHPDGNRIQIKDWKFTGKVNPESYALEMDVFAMLHFWKHPEVQRIDTGLVWLKVKGPETRTTYNREDLSQLEDKIMGNIDRIEESKASNDWKMQKSGLCFGWCSCVKCPNWKSKK